MIDILNYEKITCFFFRSLFVFCFFLYFDSLFFFRTFIVFVCRGVVFSLLSCFDFTKKTIVFLFVVCLCFVFFCTLIACFFSVYLLFFVR